MLCKIDMLIERKIYTYAHILIIFLQCSLAGMRIQFFKSSWLKSANNRLIILTFLIIANSQLRHIKLNSFIAKTLAYNFFLLFIFVYKEYFRIYVLFLLNVCNVYFNYMWIHIRFVSKASERICKYFRK